MSEMKKEVIDVFQRVEDKYPMTKAQARELLEAMKDHITEDAYFRYTVRSVYFDNDDSQLVIRSLMKPKYKMKLRLRCYGEPEGNTPVFLETKKKYGDIVYKKRIQLSEEEAEDYIDCGIMHHVQNNTASEIDYLMNYYNLSPKVYIAYDRQCYSSRSERDVRITFDYNVRYRLDNVDLHEYGSEEQLTDDDTVVMEVKAMDRYPMWLVRLLSERKMYRQSFSKYARIYSLNQNEMNPQHSAAYAYNAISQKEKMLCSVQY